ncbi:RNA recognition motif-containing protein [Arabidopsis lyrata subsp. lyrata]|uniref:RNA recognition motif-containing protein n=1 Tax=Arabidopsis lyrata subsp. lyrata TaxID=81972 RepID=D7L1B8_ARALL|nr:RNA recognition motif-containing protein [Arabidopsis lyrata subsp. lyrata]
MGSRSRNDNFQSGDGASPGKIFIGGLHKDTTNTVFNKHFGKYGEITDSVIMRDRHTGQPRGFGFITFADPSVVDKVIEDNHIINGKQVEIKRTIPKGAGGNQSKDFKTKKIFVGGIPSTVTEDELKDFFSKYGNVVEHQVIRDHETNRSRGFGFVIFDSEEVVDELLSKGNMIDMADTQVSFYKWGLELWYMHTYISWFHFEIFCLFLSLYTFNLVRILPSSLPNVRRLSQ